MDALVGAVPDGWAAALLGDVCDIQPGPSGSVTRAARKSAPGAGVVVISAQSVGEGEVDSDRLDWVAPSELERLQRFRLRRVDIVMTRIGGRPRHALIGDRYDGALQGGSCLRLRPRSDLQPEYLCHYLEHPAVQDWLALNVRHTMIKTLSKAVLARLPVAFPPGDDEQRRAVEALRVVDEHVRAHREVVRLGLALRRAMVAELWAGGRPDLAVEVDDTGPSA